MRSPESDRRREEQSGELRRRLGLGGEGKVFVGLSWELHRFFLRLVVDEGGNRVAGVRLSAVRWLQGRTAVVDTGHWIIVGENESVRKLH